MLQRLELIREGNTELCVPAASLGGGVPETHPVFFNPAGRMNRDVSVSVAEVTKPRDFLDVLAGTGARGIRIANECGSFSSRAIASGKRVTLVDFNRDSLAVARKSVAKNSLERMCNIVHSEATRYLSSRFDREEKCDAIDVDPFGTPAPFLQAALAASSDGGLVSFTATDAAVLCGVYPRVSMRRYGAVSVRSEFMHETGIRILIGFAARMGGINDIGVEPVLVHSTLHYLRAYVRVRKGATNADDSARRLGYITQCNRCFEASTAPVPSLTCSRCGTRARSAGPLWTGRLVDEDMAKGARAVCAREGWREAELTLASLKGVGEFPPYGYSLGRACSRQKVPSVSVEAAMERLSDLGFKAIRQPFEDEGIKTDSTYAQFQEAVRYASRAEAR